MYAMSCHILHVHVHVAERKRLMKAMEKDEKESEEKETKEAEEPEVMDANKELSMPEIPAEPVEPLQSPRVVADTPHDLSPPPEDPTEDSAGLVEGEADPVSMATKLSKPLDDKIGTLEKIFAVLNIDKALSLLAAILPQDLSVSTCIDACEFTCTCMCGP